MVTLILVTEPSYTRLPVDERRSQLLELGTVLFARHAYDALSMAQIAREADISKALLYHYFPSKSEYFQETLSAAALDLQHQLEPLADLPPPEALAASLDVFLSWVEANELAYRRVLESSETVIEVKALVAGLRQDTATRLIEGLAPNPRPLIRAAVRGWLALMDGVCLDWLDNGDMSREEVKGLLMGSLFGVLTAAGWQPPD